MQLTELGRLIGEWDRKVPASEASTALLNVLTEIRQQLEGAKPAPLLASSECPICHVDTPHAHDDREIETWIANQAARFGLKAYAFREPPEPLKMATDYIDAIRWDQTQDDADSPEEVVEGLERFVIKLLYKVRSA